MQIEPNGDGHHKCLVTVPDMNKAAGKARRETAETICEELTAMFNELIGGGDRDE